MSYQVYKRTRKYKLKILCVKTEESFVYYFHDVNHFFIMFQQNRQQKVPKLVKCMCIQNVLGL